MQNERQKLVKELAKECTTVDDVHEKIRDLFKDTLQEIFETEMEEHLGYQKHDNAGNNSGNSRNGYSKKTIKSRFGESALGLLSSIALSSWRVRAVKIVCPKLR